MTHALLLTHFDRLVDAPNAIPRLRQLILDLAVRGKLVEQDQKEEPATELLSRIQAEKARLVDEGRIKKVDLSPTGRVQGSPLPVPSRWVLSTLQSLCISVTDGDHVPPPKAEQGIPFLVIGNVRTQSIEFTGCRYVSKEYYDGLDWIHRPQKGDILYTLVGSYGIPVMVTTDQYFCVQRHIGILRPSRSIDVGFLSRALASSWAFSQATACATGIAQKTVPLAGLRKILIPLPPLAEQHRIIAKVDELMALCDRLEAAQAERESRRDRLAAASLQRLNQPADAPAFREHARFHLSHLQRLTTRPEQIKQLRQTIINMAVHGQLTRQDPNDEPASLLLTRLAADTKAYCQERGISPPKPEPFDEKSVSYKVPTNWIWTRLCTLFRVVTDGDHQPPPKSEEGIAFLTIGNITTGKLDFSQCRFVPKEYFESIAEYRRPARGDILYTIVGATYGRPAFVETNRSFCVQRHIAILKPASDIVLKYLCFLLASPLVYEQATRSTTGTAQPTIPLRPLRNFLVPLPPLAEQHRIVAKVDELMALCDRLEAQLTTTQTQSRRLLEAVLHEALASA